MLTARESRTSRTDVISLHAELLGLEELGAAYLASIEFSGLIRESAEQGEVPFRELWMLAGSKDDGAPSWRLARQQALLLGRAVQQGANGTLSALTEPCRLRKVR